MLLAMISMCNVTYRITICLKDNDIENLFSSVTNFYSIPNVIVYFICQS